MILRHMKKRKTIEILQKYKLYVSKPFFKLDRSQKTKTSKKGSKILKVKEGRTHKKRDYLKSKEGKMKQTNKEKPNE